VVGEFSFDASSLEALQRDLREAADRFTVETDKTLVEVGGLVSATAKMVAKEEGSSSIPPTIRSIPGPDVVVVTAGSKEVPLAALWDLGNKGKSKRDEFWHPVFGNRKPGALQKRHPILKRARSLARPMINDLMKATYDRVLEPLRRS
jgi:hypothetical protein